MSGAALILEPTGLRIDRNVSLAPKTSFRVGGEARFFCAPENLDQLAAALAWARDEQHEVYVIGGGTNMLVADEGVDALALSTEALFDPDKVAEADESACTLTLLSGTPLKRTIHEALRRGWQGLESFVGIPGTIGGAVYGNAGSRGHWLQEVVAEVLLFDGDGHREWVAGASLPWAYRSSGIGRRVIGSVRLQLEPADKKALGQVAKDLFNRKRDTQPLQAYSAGCVFKNPDGGSAGELIDRAGLKGFRQGGAAVSAVHANFLVNEEGATAAEVESLIRHVERQVRERFGVQFEREIVRIPRVPRNEDASVGAQE